MGFRAVVWFRGEAETYSILTALGPEELKIALINSTVVVLQQSDFGGTLQHEHCRTFNNFLLH